MTKFKDEVTEKPSGIPVMHQDWRNLLFLHWEYSPEEIQKTLPPGLYVDTFEEKAYLTVAPFTIENLRIANMLSIPGFSSFIEVNFRTYVVDKNGIPGIWFYSLDINSFFGVLGARMAYALPYFFADLTQNSTTNEINIMGNRANDPKIKMKFSYQPKIEKPFFAKQGTLDFFLIERYVLFSFYLNQLNLARVHHQPYPLQSVEKLSFIQNIEIPFGFKLLNEPNYINYASGVDVDIFGLKKVIIYKKPNETTK